MLSMLIGLVACVAAWAPAAPQKGTLVSASGRNIPRRSAACALLSNEQRAAQAIAWYDELRMLEVVCMGELQHAKGALSADAIEAVIAACGGNVSRYLMPDERSLPDGSDPSLSNLEVHFWLPLRDDEDEWCAGIPASEASLVDLMLGVRFEEGYPFLGALPRFELASSAPLPAEMCSLAMAAAEVAVREAVDTGDSNAIYTALGAAKQALARYETESGSFPSAGGSAANGDADDDGDSDGDDNVMVAPDLRMQPEGSATSGADGGGGGGAWTVLRPHGRQLYDVLTAWDSQRLGIADSSRFRQAVAALAALGVCSRQPSNGELDVMYEALCDGGDTLPLVRLLEPLDHMDAVLQSRMHGIESCTWAEINAEIDAEIDAEIGDQPDAEGVCDGGQVGGASTWFAAACRLRHERDLRGRDLNGEASSVVGSAAVPCETSDKELAGALHLFAAEEGGWGDCGRPVALAACGLLLLDRQGRGTARLLDLAVSSAVESADFEWEWRLVDAADMLAEQKGHLWLSVSATMGSRWHAALLDRGYRPHVLPDEDEPDETARVWLIKSTPLRDRV